MEAQGPARPLATGQRGISYRFFFCSKIGMIDAFPLRCARRASGSDSTTSDLVAPALRLPEASHSGWTTRAAGRQGDELRFESPMRPMPISGHPAQRVASQPCGRAARTRIAGGARFWTDFSLTFRGDRIGHGHTLRLRGKGQIRQSTPPTERFLQEACDLVTLARNRGFPQVRVLHPGHRCIALYPRVSHRHGLGSLLFAQWVDRDAPLDATAPPAANSAVASRRGWCQRGREVYGRVKRAVSIGEHKP